MIVVKLVIVNAQEWDRCGLGLTIDAVVERVVGGINITTTRNNNIGIINVLVFDETVS